MANSRVMVHYMLWYFFVLYVGAMLYLLSILDIKTLLIFVIVVIGVLPLIRRAISWDSDVLSPTALLPFTYTLYALGPLMISEQFSQQVVIYYLLLQLFGLLAMRLGLHIAVKQRYNPNILYTLNSLSGSSKTLWILTFTSMMLLSAVSLITYLNTFGSLIGYIKVGYGGQFYLTLKEGGIIGGGFEWCALSAVLLLFYGIKRHSKLYLFVGVIFFVFTAGIILLTGRRSQLIYPLLFGFTLFHYGHKRLPAPVVSIGILLGISLAQFYSLARSFLTSGLIYALSRVWSSIVRNPYLIAPWAADEFKMPASSLLEVLQYGGPGLLLGRSYIASLGAPIPFMARFFSQVSFNLNEWRLNTFYSGLLETGAGLAFSPVTEAYVNFGVIGVFFHLFFYGYVIGKIYNLLLTKLNWSILLLFAGSLPMFMLDGVRIFTASFVWRWVRIYLMPWIFFTVLKIFLSKQSKPSHTLGEGTQNEEDANFIQYP